MYFIVLGTSYSGSGFLFDYIESSGFASTPLGDKEYLLGHIPYGFMTLANCLANKNAHIGTTDHFVKKFFFVAQRLGQEKSIWNTGMGYSAHLPEYDSALRKLEAEITLCSFDYDLYWNWFASSLWQRLSSRINYPSIKKRNVSTVELGIDVDLLASRFHDLVFRKNLEKTKPILLNQAGIATSPVHSTRFFSDRKVMVVVRDPRDQFTELKAYKHMSDVKAFCLWYENFMETIISLPPNPNMRVWQFEKLVLDFNNISNDINRFLGIPAVKTFDRAQSLKNLGRFSKDLHAEEINYIEANLGRFLYDF